MNNSNRQSNSGWYAPMVSEPVRTAAQELQAPRRRGMPLGWRIALGTLLALGLIVGTSLFFSGRDRQPASPQFDPSGGSGFSVFLPEVPGGFANILPEGKTDEEMPEDWKEYFNSFSLKNSANVSST